MLTNNSAQRNADYGFDVEGVTDGGGQKARLNLNPMQCLGVVCTTLPATNAAEKDKKISRLLKLKPKKANNSVLNLTGAVFEDGQLRHR